MTTLYINNKDDLPERKPFDLYRTEHTLIRAALDVLQVSDVNGPLRVLDAGAGDGRWGLDFRKYWGVECALTGVELREEEVRPYEFRQYDDWFNGTDYLTWKTNFLYDMIIGNPPFRYAEEFVRKSWDLLKPGGDMCFLLRTAFQESVGRYKKLFVTHCPIQVGQCVRRPSFYGNKTNADSYSVFYWGKDDDGVNRGMRYRRWTTFLLYHEREEKK